VLAATMRRSRLGPLAAIMAMTAAVFFLTSCTPQVNAELQADSGVNAIRVQGGLPALTPDAALVQVARARSQDMAANNYFSHYPPDGCNYICLMDQYGVSHAWAGENIAWNTWDWSQTALVAVQMWQNSPPHMENIMNCHFTRFGTGVAKAADGKVYFTMIFEGARAC
jgi:uncharacterized protein YkwD